jgi:hypothetical protein
MKATFAGIFSGTFDFLKANWLMMIGMFVSACVVLGLLGYLMVGSFFSMAARGVEPDPAAMLAMMGQLFLFYLIVLVALYGISLSVWRHGMTNGEDPVFSNFGWALLGGVTLTLLYIGLMIAIYIVFAIIIGILLMLVGGGAILTGAGGVSPETMGGPAFAVIILLYIAFIAAWLWVWARISVIGPVMAAERTVNPFTGLVQSWRLTRASQWTIVGFMLVAAIGAVLLFMVAGLITGVLGVPLVAVLLYIPLLLFWWSVPPAIYGQVAAPDHAAAFE